MTFSEYRTLNTRYMHVEPNVNHDNHSRWVETCAGWAGDSYRFNRSSEQAFKEFGEAQTVCTPAGNYSYDSAAPQKSDCLSSNAEFRAIGSTICIQSRSDIHIFCGRTPPLVIKGTCRITLLRDVGLCFSLYLASTHCQPAEKLQDQLTCKACTNLSLMTSGSHTITYSPIISRRNDTTIRIGTSQKASSMNTSICLLCL